MRDLEQMLLGVIIGVVIVAFVPPAPEASAETPTAATQHIADNGMRPAPMRVRHPYEGAKVCVQVDAAVRCDNGYNGPVVR